MGPLGADVYIHHAASLSLFLLDTAILQFFAVVLSEVSR